MKTTMKITLRAFPVKIQDTRTGEIKEDRIVASIRKILALPNDTAETDR